MCRRPAPGVPLDVGAEMQSIGERLGSAGSKAPCTPGIVDIIIVLPILRRGIKQ